MPVQNVLQSRLIKLMICARLKSTSLRPLMFVAGIDLLGLEVGWRRWVKRDIDVI